MAKKNEVEDEIVADAAQVKGATVVQATGSSASIAPVIPVGVYKISPEANAPEYATDGSMCFDLKVCLGGITGVKTFNSLNVETVVPVGIYERETMKSGFPLEPGSRAMVPTGLIFDIPVDHAMVLYPRSGLSLKQGVKLANCTAVIDYDYVDQTYILLENGSNTRVVVMDGERICQGEVVVQPPRTKFTILDKRPGKKTTRSGGLGSTGK